MNIIDKLNKNKFLVPFIVLLVFILLTLYGINVYRYDIKLSPSKYGAYKSVLGVKSSFELTIYKNGNEIIKKLSSDKDVNFDSNPIYLDNNMIIFPSQMDVIFPYDGFTEYRSDEFLTLEKSGNINYLINYGKKWEELYFFLFDGIGLYFFTSSVQIYVNDSLIATLGENSYVSLYDGSLVYYDKSLDFGDVIDINLSDKIMVKDKFINLDLRSNKIGDNLLLSSNINNLSSLKLRNNK